jgi:tRNA(Ile)-lysidine synthetase-like protein
MSTSINHNYNHAVPLCSGAHIKIKTLSVNRIDNRIDNRINSAELEKVHRFWFPNSYYQDFWFSSSRDDEIRIMFGELLHRLEEMSTSDIIDLLETDNGVVPSHLLAIVICLDQFSRNIYRLDDDGFRHNDTKCLQIINHFLDMNMYPDNIINCYPINERIFYLLPYRHQKRTDLLDYVVGFIRTMETEIEHLDALVSSNDSDTSPRQVKEYHAIVNRFKRATIRDYSMVKDTIRNLYFDWNDGNSRPFTTSGSKTHFLLTGQCHTLITDIIPVLDSVCHRYPTIEYALQYPYYNAKVCETKEYGLLKKFYERLGIRNASISLSGGVDSMVISYAMHHLRIDGFLDSVSAIHVDYGNRDISLKEAQVVEAWCTYLRIPLITRRIEHIRRNADVVIGIERSDYENFTRELRFNLYREAMERYAVTSIALGHHADDMSENVLMNTIRGGDLLDLFAMEDHQVISGVPIDRPLLPLCKNSIYEFAHKFEIPYLTDTTSESCLRGAVRKVVIPTLDAVDPQIRQSLMDIGRQSLMWNNTIQNMVIRPILSNIVIKKLGFYLKWKDEYAMMDQVVWATILSKVFHNMIGARMIKKRNLQNFCSWIQRRNGMIRLSNGYMGVIHDSYLILIRTGIASVIQKLRSIDGGSPNSFHPTMISTNLDLATPHTIRFNGWNITYSLMNPDLDNVDVVSQIQVSDLLDGEFEFDYRVIGIETNSKILEKMSIDMPIEIPKDFNGLYGCITYGMSMDAKTKNRSANRRFFRNLDLNCYIPKLHFFQTDQVDRIIRIRYSYE